ncbi:hypothetical protein E2C01_054321 [Portunus trituberculatus]|uniref:Uncharacterized protein n=1 Tax=Portunus trituberculatus TaxID=210409 RepID=A0A5B7GN58_PORTR|nr:hypothetical protein [Portunus trituberculatus]
MGRTGNIEFKVNIRVPTAKHADTSVQAVRHGEHRHLSVRRLPLINPAALPARRCNTVTCSRTLD